ncbi:hypothetical protein ACHAQH_004678 [Verticillium albo-atrum]
MSPNALCCLKNARFQRRHHATIANGVLRCRRLEPSYTDLHYAMPKAPLSPKSYESYTIAVVCAMSFEMCAGRCMLDNEHYRLWAKRGDPNAYKLGDLHGHTVVLACLPGQQGKGVWAI